MIKATDELYLSCKGTIEKACWSAWMRNAVIPLDDYRSYANEIFMDAAASFDGSAGTKFNSWLTTQLLRLKPYANRGGAMTIDSKGISESLVLSLDAPVEIEGRSCTIQDTKQKANDLYSSKLSEPAFQSWFERMPELDDFKGELSDDAKELVEDILDGSASRRNKDGDLVPERGRKFYEKLTPRQLYVRLYHRKHWTIERVIAARKEVEEFLQRWSTHVLPETEEENFVQEELF